MSEQPRWSDGTPVPPEPPTPSNLAPVAYSPARPVTNPAAARTAPPRAVEEDDDETLAAKLAPLEPDPEVYCGFPGLFARRTGPWTEAAPVAVIGTLLSAVGACVGSRTHLLIGNTRHPLIVWPLILGRTASGRKGTALGLVRSVLSLAAPSFDTNNLTSGLSSGEGLIHAVRDAEMDPIEAERSGKKHVDEGVADKRRLVVETEFAAVLARARRDGNTLASVLRQAWDGDNLSVLTKSSYRSTAPHIGLVAHATPREFIRRLREEELAGGTYNRLLPLASRQSKRLPHAPPVPEEVMKDLAAELGALLESVRETSPRLERTPAADEVWADELYGEFTADDEEDERVGQFVARAAPYCLRLAGLYCLLDGAGPRIDVTHLRAAAALVRFSMMTVRSLYNVPTTVKPAEDRLRTALVENGELSKSQLYRVLNGNYPMEELEQMLDNIGASSTQVRHNSGRGRPRTVYWLPE